MKNPIERNLWISIGIAIALIMFVIATCSSCAAYQEQLTKPNNRDYKILWQDDNAYYVNDNGFLIEISKGSEIYHEFRGYLVCDSTIRFSFERR